MNRKLLPAVLAAACQAAPALADPMKPLGAAASAPAAAATPIARASPPPRSAPALKERLVAIRTDEHGRRRALLGETWSAVGDRVGEWSVSQVGAHHVELRAGAHRQLLHLLTPLQSAPPAGALALGGRQP